MVFKKLFETKPFTFQINERWNILSDGQKLSAGIIATNIAVFLMWRIIPLQKVMITYFCSSPTSGKSFVTS